MERRLTPKGMATRQRIIEGAALEFREHGVAASTLDDIRLRTATSKSQLFHYFPDGKEQLLLAVAQHEAARVLADQQPYLGDLGSWPSWYKWRDAVVERYRRQGRTCPMGMLTAQITQTTPGAQAIASQLLAEWHGYLEAGLRRMQERGEIGRDVEAGQAAAALLAGIQGGVTIMLSTGTLTYLEAALDIALAGLKNAPGARNVVLTSAPADEG